MKLLLFALVIHLFVIPQIGGARKAISVLGSLNPFLIGAAILLEGAALAAYALLPHLLLPPDERPRFPILFGTVLASTGVNHVAPGGAATTAAMNFRLLGNAGVPREPARELLVADSRWRSGLPPRRTGDGRRGESRLPR